MLINIMQEYFSNKSIKEINENKLPIVSHNKSKWTSKNERLCKKFKFTNDRKYERFIVELIKFKREEEASVEVRFKDLEVGVIIKSYSPYIGEIELKTCKLIDSIKKDVEFYFKDEEQ